MKHVRRIRKTLPLAALALLLTWFVYLGISGGSTLFTRMVKDDAPTKGVPTQVRESEYTPEELLIETNKRRAEKGVNPLSLDPVLNDTAQRKCEDMAARDDYNHGSLQGIADQLNRRVSENIVYGYDSAKGVIDSFVGSPSHYAALIDTKYTRVGFGICPFRGSNLVVQHFSD